MTAPLVLLPVEPGAPPAPAPRPPFDLGSHVTRCQYAGGGVYAPTSITTVTRVGKTIGTADGGQWKRPNDGAYWSGYTFATSGFLRAWEPGDDGKIEASKLREKAKRARKEAAAWKERAERKRVEAEAATVARAEFLAQGAEAIGEAERAEREAAELERGGA